MRLLKLESDGSINLVEFTGEHIPPYAILSHTWGADVDELTFQDMNAGFGQHKSGYRKVEFCGTQASRDGLEYFWIDTCCIDKSSSTELAEAINSMFRWYQSADHCYVYLSDVSTSDFVQHKHHIRNSYWFTRGWTLQELLAPKSVRFYTAEGALLGTRTSLLQEIQAATRICSPALEGESLHQFSIETRLSWAEGRVTKRPEDAAYCLLGIFDINLPLIYGEGQSKAFNRLHREIRDSMFPQDYLPFRVSSDSMAGTDLSKYVSAASQRLVPQGKAYLQHIASTTQRILDSLYYKGLDERQQQVREAQIGTYEWILHPQKEHSLPGSSFIHWLSSPGEASKIFWIHGKAGSGKSTMMRFINDNMIIPDHLWPWSHNTTIFRAQYFFWNPGSEMQKSVVGLLRALLHQLVSQLSSHLPLLIPEVIDRDLWVTASTAGNNSVLWTRRNLQTTLFKLLQSLASSGTVFLLVDGLDELSGTEETRDELLQHLFTIADLTHVKICLSSRPWNSFRDAFEDCPNLRLEAATHNDIKLFIEAQLSSQYRFRHMLRYQQASAEDLMREISERASGVFLWVRLVVRQLIARIRDGDGIHKLQKQLHLIPDDLNHYLKLMFDSIPSERHYEASVLLQIALYEETDFATLHPLYLLDLLFVEAGDPDFLLSENYYEVQTTTLIDSGSLSFWLDSTLRLLNSCCMGLLECHYQCDGQSNEGSDNDESTRSLAAIIPGITLSDDEIMAEQDIEQPEQPSIPQYDLHQASELTVDFFHRTCRDFLLTPSIQTMLHNHSNGPYDARMFLLNARICEFTAMVKSKGCYWKAVNLASNILSSLARPSYRNTIDGAKLGALLGPSFESLMNTYDEKGRSASYIYPAIEGWKVERSSFLTLAIDFGLHSYVREHLTSQHVHTKLGRPILDYILRPRFPKMRQHITIGNAEPNLELLSTVLTMGADPNEAYRPSSVWCLFLCFLADFFASHSMEGQFSVYATALELMIQAGAAATLPKSWLSAKTKYEFYSYEPLFQQWRLTTNSERFSNRWAGVKPSIESAQDAASEPRYAVRDLLECFRLHLGSDIDRLKALLS